MTNLDPSIAKPGVDNAYYILYDNTDLDLKSRNTPEIEKRAGLCIQDVVDGYAVPEKISHRNIIKGKDDTPFLPEQLLAFYLFNRPLADLGNQNGVNTCEAFRKISGWSEINRALEKWLNRYLRDRYFNHVDNDSDKYVLKKEAAEDIVPNALIEIACYTAVSIIRYGASYESVLSNRIFSWVKALDSKTYSRIKKSGSGTLPKDLVSIKEEEFSCSANDAFAVIRIAVKKEEEDTYRKILEYLSELLSFGFPKSYAIEFRSSEKNYLPVKGLQKKGVHQLFATAVLYPGLHPLIEKYARLAMTKYEWYENFEAENACMPGTFAVFALALQSDKYFTLLEDYLDLCDEEHSLIQGKFMAAFIEKWGFTNETVKVFLHGACSMQELPYNKTYLAAAQNAEALSAIADSKDNAVKEVFSDEEITEKNREQLQAMVWNGLCYAIWGRDAQQGGKKLLKTADEQMKPLYQKIFEGLEY